MRWKNSTLKQLESPRLLPLVIFCGIFLALVISHQGLLTLPYYWDEAGYYIPAAWDFFRTGSLIPLSTLTNAHPPLPGIYLAAWWKLFGFSPLVTRLATLAAAALALTAVRELALALLKNRPAALWTVLLTALYPVWFAQSSLAHADIFAAACTLWGLFYSLPTENRRPLPAALCFAAAALAKETSIVVPLTLALAAAIEFFLPAEKPALAEEENPKKCHTSPRFLRSHHFSFSTDTGRLHLLSEICGMGLCILPLAGWYLWHWHKTGFFFGNPVFLRYNAQANLVPARFLAAFAHRLLHLTAHMNLFVPVLLALAALCLPRLEAANGKPTLEASALRRILLLLLANAVFFSILGGALLTRYLLPMFPLVLLLAIAVLRSRAERWQLLAGLSAVAFVAGIFVDPPYGFAPEDNLAYARFIRLHQTGIAELNANFPEATVLSAWPMTDALRRPELGYVREPHEVVSIDDFSTASIVQARQQEDSYSAALVFSTKLDPHSSLFSLGGKSKEMDEAYFGLHEDLPPATIARALNGEIVWQKQDHGLWIALIRFHNHPVYA